jgi:hypothetical protein
MWAVLNCLPYSPVVWTPKQCHGIKFDPIRASRVML